MDTGIKSIIKEINKSLTDKIIDASDQVSTNFKSNETIITDIPPDVTKEELETLKKFISDLYKQAVEKGHINLEEKTCLFVICGERSIFYQNGIIKWYYRIMFKRVVKQLHDVCRRTILY